MLGVMLKSPGSRKNGRPATTPLVQVLATKRSDISGLHKLGHSTGGHSKNAQAGTICGSDPTVDVGPAGQRALPAWLAIACRADPGPFRKLYDARSKIIFTVLDCHAAIRLRRPRQRGDPGHSGTQLRGGYPRGAVLKRTDLSMSDMADAKLAGVVWRARDQRACAGMGDE